MFRKRNPDAGSPPGTLVFRGEHSPSRVQVVRYTPSGIEEVPIAKIDDIVASVAHGQLVWIDVAGIDDPDVLRAGGEHFGLSALTMENIVNVPQRPKTELLQEQLLSIAHVLKIKDDGTLHIDQLSLVLGPNYVITVHAQPEGFLDPIRQRLRTDGSQLRLADSGFLAYAILDAIVDGYYPVLESLGERLESLEDEALEQPRPELLRCIHELRMQLIQVRRSSWPMRDSLELLARSDTPMIDEATRPFLRDTYAHCAQIVDVVEMYRESAGALISTYMSSIAHRSNEIMKVLTLISSIFVPMTFVAGVYGMNFTHMPELDHPWSYPVALLAMGLIACLMMGYFLRRGWLRRVDLKTGRSAMDSLNTEVSRDRQQQGPDRHGGPRLEAKRIEPAARKAA
jgi:magnesium transporter